MTTLLRALAILSLLLIAGFGLPAEAKKDKPAAASSDTSSDDPRTLISSTDSSKHTVTFIYKRSGITHTYDVDDFTIVTVRGVRGKFSDISSGLQVIAYVERNPKALDSITVGPASAPPAADGETKKHKK